MKEIVDREGVFFFEEKRSLKTEDNEQTNKTQEEETILIPVQNITPFPTQQNNKKKKKRERIYYTFNIFCIFKYTCTNI